MQLIRNKTEKDILNWANDQVKARGGNAISGFKDKSLASGRFLVQLCASFDPEMVDWEELPPAKSLGDDAKDAESMSKYAISLARKLGAVIFMVWDDVTMVNSKMMLIFMSGLYDLYLQK